jgi:nucleotide-binding universal stress UspA family protein
VLIVLRGQTAHMRPVSPSVPSAAGTSRTIVVGFDGSAASGRALERAAALAGNGRVILVVASPTIPTQGVVRDKILDAPSPAERDALMERGHARLRDLGATARTVPSELPPAKALIEIAREERADMILVGATGTGYVTRALLGSTAENLVRHAPCDVLIVR